MIYLLVDESQICVHTLVHSLAFQEHIPLKTLQHLKRGRCEQKTVPKYSQNCRKCQNDRTLLLLFGISMKNV